MAETLSNEDREVGNALLRWPGPMISHHTAAVRLASERIRREHIGCHDFGPLSGNHGPTATHTWMLFEADDTRLTDGHDREARDEGTGRCAVIVP